MDKILAALDEQRKQFVQQIATIDMARAIYVKGAGTKKVAAKKLGKRRHMSAATKRKLSIAAKARWAKVKKVKKETA